MGLYLSAFVVVFMALSGLPLGDGQIDDGSFLELVFSVPDPELSGQGGDQLLIVPGWNSVGATGAPLLPERTFQVPLGPFHAELVSAGQDGPWNAMTIGGIATGSPASNGFVTVMNDIRKGPLATSYGMIEAKDSNFISIRLSPYEYANGVLRYPSEVRVTIELDVDIPKTSVQVPDDLPYAQDISGSSTPIWEASEGAPSGIGTSPSYSNTIPPTEMVIITTSTYNSTLKDLALWKTKKGIYTRVVEVSWITGKYSGADTPEKIRKYLSDLYSKENLKWVILAGDHSTVPARMAYVPDGYDDGGSDGSTAPADSYYSDLTGSGANPYDWDGDNDGNYGEYSVDGIDLVPEVYVGRLSPTTATMATLVQNILNYEKNPPSGSWVSRAVVAGAYSNYKESSTTNDTTDEADLKEAIRIDFLNTGKFDVYKLYEKGGIWPSQRSANISLTNSNMVSAIDPGAFMVNMAGHGSSTGIYRRIWNADTNGNKVCDSGETTDTAYYTTSASQTNGAKKPLFYNDACNNGDFDRGTCLTEDILNDVGIGSVGSARVSWYSKPWSKGSDGGYYNQGHDYRFWQQFFNNGNHQPGKSLALSKYDYIVDKTAHDLYSWKNLMQYNLMGDPEIPIWTQSPKTLTVTYANPLPSPGEVSITVKDPSNNAVQGARVCLMNGTVFYGIATTDSSGVAKITLPTMTLSLNLTVTKNDFKVWTKAVFVGVDTTPPTISSVNFLGSTTTGDAFQVIASASDQGGLQMVCLHHAYSPTQPASFTNTTLVLSLGTYTFSSNHPQGSTHPFWYRIGAWDNRGNMNITPWTSVAILDNDRPFLGVDGSDVHATTGDLFRFVIVASDNIGIGNVLVNYTLDDGMNFINRTLTGPSTYQLGVWLPYSSIGTLRYRFLAYDSAGNVEQTSSYTRTIEDNDDPSIDLDLAVGIPTTGDEYTLGIKASDNIGVIEARASYAIGSAATQNRSMAFDGTNYTIGLSIPGGEIGTLTYKYMVRDGSGNIHWTDEVDLLVLDDDLPGQFSDRTVSPPTTGDNFTIQFEAYDNIGILLADVEYTVLGLVHVVNATFDAATDLFYAEVQVPSTATGNITLRFRATDPAGNANTSEWFGYTIIDDDDPCVTGDLSSDSGTTGDQLGLSFELKDNIGIGNATVLWALNDDGGSIALEGPYGDIFGVFFATLDLPSFDGTLSYVIVIQDTSGNELRTDPVMVPISDNDPPVILSVIFSNATTGDPFLVEAILSDNIGIGSATLELQMGNGTISADLTRLAGIWGGEVAIPSNYTGSIGYRLVVTDLRGNPFEGAWSNITVVDDDDPLIVSSGGIGSLKLATGNVYTVTIEATDNIAVLSVNLTFMSGDRTFEASADGSGPMSVSFTMWNDVVGDVDILLSVVDGSGNQDNRSFRSAIKDDDAPLMTFKDLPSTVEQSEGASFDVLAEDNIGMKDLTVRSFFGPTGTILSVVEGKYRFSPQGAGTYTIEATGSDAAGNVRTMKINVTVEDDIPPTSTISLPSDLKVGSTIELSADNVTEGVTYEWEITTPDGEVVKLTGSDVDLELDKAGTYKVKLKATDTAGNEAITETSFTLEEGPSGNMIFIFVGIGMVLLVIAVIIAFLLLRRRKVPEE
jgi:hypothetical protein